MLVDGRPILLHVVDRCKRAAGHLNKHEMGAKCDVFVLVPEHDPIKFKYERLIEVREGPEDDVLTRYVNLTLAENADFVVRITADCLFIPSHIITMAMRTALKHEHDYTSNVVYRTFHEGWDVEIISRRLIEWLHNNATSAFDREHVTTLVRDGATFPFKREGRPDMHHLLNDYDNSDIHTSVDTQEDYDRAVKIVGNLKRLKIESWKNGFFYK